MQSETIDAALATAGSKVTYAGGTVAVGSWFLSNQFFGLVGAIGVVVGLLISLHFQRKQDRRNQQEYEARMRAMGQEP